MDKFKFIVKFNELPGVIQGHALTMILEAVGILILGISIAIGTNSLTFVGITALSFIAFAIYSFYWLYPFLMNKVLVYEGTTVNVTEDSRDKTSLTAMVANEAKRFTYDLKINETVVSVIRTTRKIKRNNMSIIIYVPEDSVTQKNDGTYLINKVLFTQIVNQ